MASQSVNHPNVTGRFVADCVTFYLKHHQQPWTVVCAFSSNPILVFTTEIGHAIIHDTIKRNRQIYSERVIHFDFNVFQQMQASDAYKYIKECVLDIIRRPVFSLFTACAFVGHICFLSNSKDKDFRGFGGLSMNALHEVMLEKKVCTSMADWQWINTAAYMFNRGMLLDCGERLNPESEELIAETNVLFTNMFITILTTAKEKRTRRPNILP